MGRKFEMPVVAVCHDNADDVNRMFESVMNRCGIKIKPFYVVLDNSSPNHPFKVKKKLKRALKPLLVLDNTQSLLINYMEIMTSVLLKIPEQAFRRDYTIQWLLDNLNSLTEERRAQEFLLIDPASELKNPIDFIDKARNYPIISDVTINKDAAHTELCPLIQYFSAEAFKNYKIRYFNYDPDNPVFNEHYHAGDYAVKSIVSEDVPFRRIESSYYVYLPEGLSAVRELSRADTPPASIPGAQPPASRQPLPAEKGQQVPDAGLQSPDSTNGAVSNPVPMTVPATPVPTPASDTATEPDPIPATSLMIQTQATNHGTETTVIATDQEPTVRTPDADTPSTPQASITTDTRRLDDAALENNPQDQPDTRPTPPIDAADLTARETKAADNGAEETGLNDNAERTGSEDGTEKTDSKDGVRNTESEMGENRMVQQDKTEVQEQDKTEVPIPDKTEVQEPDKTEVQEPDKTEVQEPDKTEVQEQDKTEVQEQDKTEVQEPDKTEVQEQDKTEVQEQDKTEVPTPGQTCAALVHAGSETAGSAGIEVSATRDSDRGDSVQKVVEQPDIARPADSDPNPDILYVLGTGSLWNNNEIKFSLRSIDQYAKNYGRVLIAGPVLPSFLDKEKVIHIDYQDSPVLNGWRNQLNKVLYAIKNNGLSKKFVFMMDDVYLTKETDFRNYPVYCKGQLTEDLKSKNKWRISKNLTLELLKKKGLPTKDYELHSPIVYDRELYREMAEELISMTGAWEIFPQPRSYYCNKHRIEGVMYEDLKIRAKHLPKGPASIDPLINNRTYFSIADDALIRGMARYLKTHYPKKSRWEVAA